MATVRTTACGTGSVLQGTGHRSSVGLSPLRFWGRDTTGLPTTGQSLAAIEGQEVLAEGKCTKYAGIGSLLKRRSPANKAPLTLVSPSAEGRHPHCGGRREERERASPEESARSLDSPGP